MIFTAFKNRNGRIAPEIDEAARVASERLSAAGIRHALCGGLAVARYGYVRPTADVDFLVGDDAFEHHPGGLVTLRLPLIAVRGVAVDLVTMDATDAESAAAEPVLAAGGVVALPFLVWMKLKAARQKDLTDVVELLKRRADAIEEIDAYLAAHAPAEVRLRWERAKATAAREED